MNNIIEECLEEVPYMEYTYFNSYYDGNNFYIVVKKNYRDGFEVSKKYDKDPQDGLYIFNDAIKSWQEITKFASIDDAQRDIYIEYSKKYFNYNDIMKGIHSKEDWNTRRITYSDANLLQRGFKKFGFEGPLYTLEANIHYWVNWEVWAKSFIFRYSRDSFVKEL